MTARSVLNVLIVLLTAVPVSAQVARDTAPLAGEYVDSESGLSLQEAIARALEQEPSLRAARSAIDVARAMQIQASLRPNPTVGFERREEPAGTDNQTGVSVEWPLDLFRRSPRIAVADRELATAQLSVADRERVLAADVRARYGDVLAGVRALAILDELVDTSRRQHDLVRSRVEQGGSPPLERDLLEVELRRLESERLLQAGRTEAARVELKRVLGMVQNARLTVRGTLEDVVERESSSGPNLNEFSTAPQQRADVREAAARVDVAEAKIGRADAQGRFDVSVFANYMRMDAAFPQRGFTAAGSLERIRGLFHYVSAGAMITVPLLNRNQGEVAAARAERAGAASAHEAAQLAANAEVAAARALDERAIQAVKLYTTGVHTLARRNLAVVGETYELGRATVFDVLTEQRRYLDVERAYTDTLRAAYEAKTALYRALGGMR